MALAIGNTMADRAVYKPCFPLLDRINTLLILYLTPPLPRTLCLLRAYRTKISREG